MKRCFLIAIFLASLVLFGCATIDSSGGDSSDSSGSSYNSEDRGSIITATENDSWTYSLSSPIKQLTSQTLSVSINGDIGGKSVYLVKANPSSYAISSDNTRYINSTSPGISLNKASPEYSYQGNVNASLAIDVVHGKSASFSVSWIDCKSNFSLVENPGSRVVTQKFSPVEQVDYKVGDSKSLYLDVNSSLSRFEKSKTYLRAKGKHCNVWVAEGCYTTAQSCFKQINSSIADMIADKFDAIYELVREVYGEESDEIWYYTNSFQKYPMKYLSDTGTKVNIVVYDVAKDYGTNSPSGIVGYFFAKDFFPNEADISRLGYSYPYSWNVYNYSNEGKYFYIDSYYAVYYLNMVFSTLAHEFQHMILYGNKYMNYSVYPSTWFNEMMSMICEDMMQEFLDIDDKDSPKGRLPMFERGYDTVGLEYLQSSSKLVLQSYADTYAFGAWLVRNFGGTKLIKRLSKSPYIDVSAVIDAVNHVNGKNHKTNAAYTINDLMELYIQACLCTDAEQRAGNMNLSSFAKVPATYSSKSFTTESGSYVEYDYPFTPINLWNLSTIGMPNYPIYYKYDGPKIFQYDYNCDLRPYGIVLTKVGSIKEGTTKIDVNLNDSGLSTQKLFLVIKDD